MSPSSSLRYDSRHDPYTINSNPKPTLQLRFLVPSTSNLVTITCPLTAKVLYFFLQRESRLIQHPLLQYPDQFPHLPGGPAAGVVDEIRVVVGYLDSAQNH